MPDFFTERSFAPARVCGIDEAGRGPWAGEVVAACVLYDDESTIPDGLNDSKKLKPAARERLFDAITASASFGIGIASVDEIDRLNIWGATALAMTRALKALPSLPAIALIDGNRVPKNFPLKAQALVKGDSRSLSIAAASIVAKVTRDRMMQALHNEFPDYGFNRHMGYGTAAHSAALRTHGICRAHRKSFAPIRAMLEAA